MNTPVVTAFVLFLYLTRTISAEKYHISKRIRTNQDGDFTVYIFETILEKRLEKCIRACKAKKKCKFINYHVRAHACFLISINSDVNDTVLNDLEEKEGYIFGDKSEWNLGKYRSCEQCNDNGVCSETEDDMYSVCKNSGCPYPENKKSSSCLGNQFSAGSKITYECNEGFIMYIRETATSTCLQSGAWTMTDFLCLPAGSRKFENSYYTLVKEHKAWYDAKESCESLGGNLTDVKSREEQDFLTELSGVCGAVWIGGENMANENIFTWLDGTALSSGYTNWKAGQPYQQGGGIRCIHLNGGWSYQWDDASCGLRKCSLCKFN